MLLIIAGFGWNYLQQIPAQAALFPRLIIIITALLSLLMLVSTFVDKSQRRPAPPLIENGARLTIAVGATILYIYLMNRIGYFTSSLLYVVALAIALGYRRYATVIVSALGFMAFVFIIFTVFFNRPLPQEFFQRW
jgi:uncharacterized membrane protein